MYYPFLGTTLVVLHARLSVRESDVFFCLPWPSTAYYCRKRKFDWHAKRLQCILSVWRTEGGNIISCSERLIFPLMSSTGNYSLMLTYFASKEYKLLCVKVWIVNQNTTGKKQSKVVSLASCGQSIWGWDHHPHVFGSAVPVTLKYLLI